MDTSTLPSRLRSKISLTDSCWEWTAKRQHGYGVYFMRMEGTRATGRRSIFGKAHSVVFEALIGPIPEGTELDHLCRNKGCVNPEHLEPVTHAVNNLRGVSPPAINARKTICKRGHPLSGENLYVRSTGYRQCRICRATAYPRDPEKRKANNARYRQKRNEA